MHQPVRAGEDLDERAEIHYFSDLPQIDFADLRLLGHPLNDLHRLAGGFGIDRGDHDQPAVVDIDLDPRLFNDSADVLSAGPDDFADFLFLDRHRQDPRGMDREVRPWGRYRFQHLAQNVKPSL